jgi:hypothetical protein
MWLFYFFASNLILVAPIYYGGPRDQLNLKILCDETYMACFGWLCPYKLALVVQTRRLRHCKEA